MRAIWTSLACLIACLPAPLVAQDQPVELLQEARASAAQCDFETAREINAALLNAVGQQDPALRLAALQEAATYANEAGAPDQALIFATEAMDIAARGEGGHGTVWAMVAQNRAVALSELGRFDEASSLFTEILALAHGTINPDQALEAYRAASRHAFRASRPQLGLELTERLHAVATSGAGSEAAVINALIQVLDGYRRMLRFAEADRVLEAAMAASEAPPPPRLELNRARLDAERGDLREALVRVSELTSLAASPCDPYLEVDSFQLLGTIQMLRREVPEAIASFGLALRELELAARYDAIRAAEISYGLAIATSMGGEFDRSSDLFDRSAQLYREVYGRPTEAEAQVQMERALMLIEADVPELAMLIAEEAIAMLETDGVEVRPLTFAYARATLGLAAHEAGESLIAARELAIALDGFTQARGESFDLAPGLLALAEIASARGDLQNAEAQSRRALEIYRQAGGDSALGTGTALSRLALVAELGGDSTLSRDYSQQAMEVLQRRLAIGEQSAWNDAEKERRAGDDIIANELRLVSQDCPAETAAQCAERLFTALQLASATRAGAAITQLANRLEVTEPALAALLRERSDLADEWRTIQDFLIGALAQNDAATTSAARAVLVQRLPQIEARITAIDSEIRNRNPQLDLLLKTRVVDRDTVRDALEDGEAFLSLAIEDDRSYVTVLHEREQNSYWVPVGREEIDRLASAIRLSIEPDSSGILYEYDLAAARELFARLFDRALPFLEGIDRLAYVPDGSLASLPLTVLLTDDASVDLPYAEQSWLGRRFIVSNFPSAASLVALRSIARPNSDADDFLGIGDPDFDGSVANTNFRGNLITSLTRSRLADVDLIRAFAPLPETRREIEAIASQFPEGRSQTLLGEASNEAQVRETDLSAYDIIAFATHAVVAGEIRGYAEPAIILTPPDTPSDFNDGLLSASEIANLDLNARLVILSACNTAADNGDLNAEPLSGLAQAFFYAGARSLLVSHWRVESTATADLTVRLIELQNEGFAIGTALQVVMEEFLEAPDTSRDHPFFWAPFVVIG